MSKKSKTQKDVEKYRKQSMTKKALKEYYKKDRGAVFTTSSTTFKSGKEYNRQRAKQDTRKALNAL